MKPAILVGRGLLGAPSTWGALGPTVCLVSEPGAFRRFGRRVLRALPIRPAVHLLPRGEAAKTPAALARAYRAFLRAGLGRDGAVVALGGGAVTDLAGYAAATWLRGVRWVSAPTTLLGQVDSGIGGKVGLNLPEGKNLVGAFHQPVRVVCDLDVLASLPPRERLSGLGEALKYGMIFDARFWRFMTSRWDALLRLEPGPLEAVVRRCAREKTRVVAADERETTGLRALLNFGHTFGHALEAAAGYGTFRHGEAVLWGMRAALALSTEIAGLPWSDAEEASAFLTALRVPPIPRRVTSEALLEAMRRDKKARAGRLGFVLLKRLGEAAVYDGVSDAAALRAVRVAGLGRRPGS